jgi:hypothetical protein
MSMYLSQHTYICNKKSIIFLSGMDSPGVKRLVTCLNGTLGNIARNGRYELRSNYGLPANQAAPPRD